MSRTRNSLRTALVALAALSLTAGTLAPTGPAAAATTVYQAENATISQGVVESNWPGFTGTGFVNYNSIAGSYVEWTVTTAQAGTGKLSIRYANGGTTSRPMDITVNGVLVADEHAFPPTGAWSTWQTVATTATLNTGTNTIRATATTASGGPNVDSLAVEEAGAFSGVIYVSPTGDDANPGTQDRPVATLHRARDLVRGMNQNMAGDIAVEIAAGTYRLSQPLALDTRDSGTNGHDVIYRAAPGARPVISGGVRVTGWQLSDAGRNIWSAPAPASVTNTRQLYVDGARAQRARGRVPVTITATTTGYTASADTMSRWRSHGDIEFVYTGGNRLWSDPTSGLGGWTEPRCPVGSISGTTITMAQPCWDNSTKRVTNLVGPSTVGLPTHVENAYELLDQAGEWYLDRAARTFFYVPRTGEDLATADVEAPVLETLVSGSGTTSESIHDIVFSGLQFSYATWLRPSTGEGFSEVQANFTVTGAGGYATQGLCDRVPDGTCPYGAWTKAHGNVWFTYDRGIELRDGAFVHLGGAALNLGNGSQSAVVTGNTFTDVSASGIQIGDVNIVGPTAAQLVRDNSITNNHLYNLPAEYRGGVAVFVGYAQNTTVAHNQIDHTSYTAISTGWGGWLQKEQKPGLANPSRNTRIADNVIFDHVQSLSDGGAVYNNGIVGTTLADGEKITGNVVRDQFGSGKGLYTDNASAYVTISGNAIVDTNYRDWGTTQRDWGAGGALGPMRVENNHWEQGDPDSIGETVTVRGNRIIAGLGQAPAAILDNAGLEPAYEHLLTRRFSASVPEPPTKVAAWVGNTFAYVAWCSPVNEGGSPIASYTVTSSRGQTVTVSASDFRRLGYVKMTGLANGTSHTFTVRASNATGTSAASIQSRSVTPGTATVTVPSVPKNVQAYVTGSRASVRFVLPDSTGGSPIISYTVRGNARTVKVTGRVVLVLTGGTHFHYGVIEGLQPGTTYTFTVTADNVAGSSSPAQTTVTTPPA